MAIYETIDRKRQEARELKNKSHSMEALETPNASIKGDDDQNSTYDFKLTEVSEQGMHQTDLSVSSSARRRYSSPTKRRHSSCTGRITSSSTVNKYILLVEE